MMGEGHDVHTVSDRRDVTETTDGSADEAESLLQTLQQDFKVSKAAVRWSRTKAPKSPLSTARSSSDKTWRTAVSVE